MPVLNGMTCRIDIGQENATIEEHGIEYGSQSVTCFVNAPSTEVSFSIHFVTTGYVGPGVAVFVFIDGVYQLNRNQTGLSRSDGSSSRDKPEVEFRLRQKEEVSKDGRFITGREWRFQRLKYAKPGDDPNLDKTMIFNFGTIEVVVLRCQSNNNLVRGAATDTGSSLRESPNKSLAYRPNRQKPEPATCKTASSAGQSDGAADGGEGETYRDYQRRRDQGRTSSRRPEAQRKQTIGIEVSPITHAKPYWAAWDPTSRGYTADPVTSDKRSFVPRDPYIDKAYDQPKVCPKHTGNLGIDHQVVTGPGARYDHPRARPVYLDTMDAPFAVFTFYYRHRKPLDNKTKSIVLSPEKSVHESVQQWNDGNEVKAASVKTVSDKSNKDPFLPNSVKSDNNGWGNSPSDEHDDVQWRIKDHYNGAEDKKSDESKPQWSPEGVRGDPQVW